MMKRGASFFSEREIFRAASSLIDSINLSEYDIIALRYGNLEVEQLIPLILKEQTHPPIVYHGHTLEPTLFRDHVSSPAKHEKVSEAHFGFEQYLFFGRYARCG